MEEKKRKGTPYANLTPEAKRKNIECATAYNREKAAKITIKTKKENFVDVENYMNECRTCGKSKSKNCFLLEAIRYAIAKDFKGIRD